ncbi:TIGR03943 family putative permease subunit [Kineothrix sp. MB12-C1]|uniref:TIGR03943 family putative permease subunit n=1 Tax=Kineothrix sp. MB12-C1 TaxID=3070215 RepID=UPI0027D25A1B|nr:TIGR03943 family protein [Kineothrix sp. MB12-C1]WMC94177.1 TIGR03943 family protein [Kineothrix sp. MB12-C1]
MQIYAKKLNPQIFLEILCYFTFAALIISLLGNGKYLSYVTPRMKPYLIFSAITMVIWGLAAARRLFRPQYKIRSMHCFVLAIPILLILLPHSSLGISDVSGGYVSGNVLSGQTNQYNSFQSQNTAENSNPNSSAEVTTENPSVRESEPDVTDTYSSNDAFETQSDVFDSVDFPGLDEANKTITVSNEDFGMWIYELYVNMEKYAGYKIIMTGFIFKDPEFLEADEFVPARLSMSCCVADLVPTGLICKYDKASELETDSWITVEGTLYIEEYKYDDMSFDEPLIHVTKITPAEAVDEYVYPYY